MIILRTKKSPELRLDSLTNTNQNNICIITQTLWNVEQNCWATTHYFHAHLSITVRVGWLMWCWGIKYEASRVLWNKEETDSHNSMERSLFGGWRKSCDEKELILDLFSRNSSVNCEPDRPTEAGKNKTISCISAKHIKVRSFFTHAKTIFKFSAWI